MTPHSGSRDIVQPVILAGGSGTRLWPMSRAGYPKQFQALIGDAPLFTQTLERLDALDRASIRREPPLVVCNDEHRFLVAELLRTADIDGAGILLEPAGRNTAAAITLAALEAAAEGGDPILLVLPADHAIQDLGAFASAMAVAVGRAAGGELVTFGIPPTAPETGYGYIRAAAAQGPCAVERFVEKPDRETAEGFLSEGGHYWNSGMFVFRASVVLEALARHAPAVLEAVTGAWQKRHRDLDFLRIDAEAFAAAPARSIDHAVMEHTDRAAVVPLDVGWSDIGSWSAVWQQARDSGTTDARGNALRGDAIVHEADDCLVHADHRLVGAVGVRDLIIVETADAVMVCPRERAQCVRELVERLHADGRSEPNLHRRVYRPWGSYEGLDLGDRFQVKRIVVKPHGCLSLQMHHHRAEHWVVVRGTAKVTHDGDTFLLTEDQSTYIPLGTVHRLENPGNIPLELIEVQTGGYLGEDDIVRFEDHYGRG